MSTNGSVSAPARLREAGDACRLKRLEELMGGYCPRAAVQNGRYRGHSITGDCSSSGNFEVEGEGEREGLLTPIGCCRGGEVIQASVIALRTLACVLAYCGHDLTGSGACRNRSGAHSSAKKVRQTSRPTLHHTNAQAASPTGQHHVAVTSLSPKALWTALHQLAYHFLRCSHIHPDPILTSQQSRETPPPPISHTHHTLPRTNGRVQQLTTHTTQEGNTQQKK